MHNSQQLHVMDNTQAQLSTTNLHNSKHNTWFVFIVQVCCAIMHLCKKCRFMYKTWTISCALLFKKWIEQKVSIVHSIHSCALWPTVLSIVRIYVVQHENCAIVHYFKQLVPTVSGGYTTRIRRLWFPICDYRASPENFCIKWV